MPASGCREFSPRHHRDAGQDCLGHRPASAGRTLRGFPACSESPPAPPASVLSNSVVDLVLDVDQGDGMAGIGKSDRDAPAHTAGSETGNCGSGGGHWANPSRNKCCNWFRSRSPKPNACRLRSGAAPGSAPQTAPPIARKAFAKGVANAAQGRRPRPGTTSQGADLPPCTDAR